MKDNESIKQETDELEQDMRDFVRTYEEENLGEGLLSDIFNTKVK